MRTREIKLSYIKESQVPEFEKRPQEVRLLADIGKMTDDEQKHIRGYVSRFLQARSSEDAVRLLKLFRRIIPELIARSEWQIIDYFSRAADKAARTNVFFKPGSDLPATLLGFVFKDQVPQIAMAYDNVADTQRAMINDVCARLDALGVEILTKALSGCEQRGARKAAMEALIKSGSLARDWTRQVLDTPGHKWYLIRNALMLLGYVGNEQQDAQRAVRFIHHEHPRVRDEALNIVIRFNAASAENLVVEALDDVDDKVRWRAMNGLAALAPISQGSVKKVLQKIHAATPQDGRQNGKNYRRIGQLVQALGSVPDLPILSEVEDVIIDMAAGFMDRKKRLLKRFKKSSAADPSGVLTAVVATLGNIGTLKSESFLEQLGESKSPLAEAARKAANNIKLRAIEKLSNTPP